MSRKEQHREENERLRRLIQSWNQTRVELFKISRPKENGEFSGVMKFYYQYEEKDGQKVATKCIRVSSFDCVTDVIEILVQKFRPDLKMLPNLSSYSLYEIHNESREGEVRKMDSSEKPLVEMMKWSEGDRDGRFLLRNESQFRGHKKGSSPKKTKKVPKTPKEQRKPKHRSSRANTDDQLNPTRPNEGVKVAKTLYENYPSSKFTRSITNPEIVKNLWTSAVDKRLRSSYQAIDELGSEENSLRIMTDSLLPTKTILATDNETVSQILRGIVEKFRLDTDPSDLCIVEVTLPPVGGNGMGGKYREVTERVLGDHECPVKLHTRCMLGSPGVVNRDILNFQLRRRASFMPCPSHLQEPCLPCLVDISHTPTHHHKKYPITSFPVEIGSQSFLLNPHSHICLSSPSIAPKHCMIEQTYRGTYTIQLLNDTALVMINEQTVANTTPLPVDSVIKLSEDDVFKFSVPNQSLHSRSNSAITSQMEKTKEQIGKAYSTDNLASTNDENHSHAYIPTHNRTFSEHTLKGEGETTDGDEIDEDKDHFDLTDDDTSASITNIKTTRNIKKRHNSAPHCGDLHFLEETPESELAVLPASISFQHQSESLLLQCLISDVKGGTLEFKLAPAYSLYMIARHHLSSEYHPDSSRHHSLIHMIKQTCSLIKRVVKDSKGVAGVLAFWLSNTSELLHFLRRDYRLCMFAHEYENTLTSIIHMAYKHFTYYMVCEVGMYLSAFLSESPEADKEDILFKYQLDSDQLKEPDVLPHGTLTRQASLTSLYWLASNPKLSHKTKPTIGCVMSTLKAAISLLHQCRVNSTLSILIFNLLFRYISMKLFNKLMTDIKACTQNTGAKLIRRLDRLKAWSMKEGLSTPAEEHLVIIYQAGIFLQCPKSSPEDVRVVASSCNRLNSRQITKLLANYEIAEGEGSVNIHFKEKLAAYVQNVDKDLISAGQQVTLAEDPNLELPFLIPEQGYSCDTMRGLPMGLEEYLEKAINAGICQLHITKDTLGCWVPPRMTTSNQRESPMSTQASTTQMSQTLPKNFLQHNPYASLGDHDIHRPHSEINLAGDFAEPLRKVTVKLRKANKTLGINICERKVTLGHNQEELLIFIKSLSDEGPAKNDGRVSEGDQILKVDSTVLRGYTRQMVIKLLSNSGSEVNLTLAKKAAEHYGLIVLPDGNSPYNERKGNSFSPQSFESSHSIKAQRRQQHQQLNDMNLYKHMSNQTDNHPPVYNGYNQTARWIQEQRDRSHHTRPTDHLRQAKPSQSLNSLIPEKDETPSRPFDRRGSVSTTRNIFDSHLTTTPSGSDLSDTASQHGHSYQSGKYSMLGTSSKLHDPLSASKSSYADFSAYLSRHRLSVDSQLPSGSDMPASLSVQMSESSDPNGSQAYPSLMLEKLSMEVGCHTQSNVSSAGITVTSVLEQLAQKSREAKEKSGLKKNELKGLEVDELELEKQRMKFLFYEQGKESKDRESLPDTLDKQAPMDSNAKVSEWVNKDQDAMTEEEEELLMDPEKLLQITNLQGKLESLKKMVSEQRKKNREMQFAKERVKQSLQEEEKKAQQARSVRPFMKIEDQARWQKDQKKRMKEWEKLKKEKTNDLQRYECKEREGRSRLKALEQHLGEVKKQLQACEGSAISRPISAATSEFGSTKLLDDIPERDWMSSSRPPRIMSTDSITTESSLMSGDNPDIPKDLMSLDSDFSIPDFNISATRNGNSPYGNRSNSSSPIGHVSSSYKNRYAYNPDFHGSMEMRPMMGHKIPLTRGYSADQEKRLRLLKQEHLHHISSMDNIPAYTNEDRTVQLNQVRQEAMHNLDERPVLELPAHPWSKSSTNVSHYKGSIDSSNVESSLSNTPDVIPEFLVKPIQQSSSAMHLPHPEGTRLFSYGKHSRPSSGLSYSEGQSSHPSRVGLRFGPSSSSNSTEFLNGVSSSRDILYDKKENLPTDLHPYLSHGNVSSLHHRGGFEIGSNQNTDSNRQKKQTKQSNSPSTHKYSHRRPDASLNGDDRSKYRSNTSNSHSNLFTVGHAVQKMQSEL